MSRSLVPERTEIIRVQEVEWSALRDALQTSHKSLHAKEAWSDPDPLSDRERQVLRSAEEGQTSADIAAKLGLSEGTVRNYLSEAISKLGVTNRIEAARLARQRGWL